VADESAHGATVPHFKPLRQLFVAGIISPFPLLAWEIKIRCRLGRDDSFEAQLGEEASDSSKTGNKCA